MHSGKVLQGTHKDSDAAKKGKKSRPCLHSKPMALLLVVLMALSCTSNRVHSKARANIKNDTWQTLALCLVQPANDDIQQKKVLLQILRRNNAYKQRMSYLSQKKPDFQIKERTVLYALSQISSVRSSRHAQKNDAVLRCKRVVTFPSCAQKKIR